MLLNPAEYSRDHNDERSRDIALKTIEFFEHKGLARIKADDQAMVWYADFLDFIKENGVFATLLTPEGYGDADSRWDMWRISEYNEILGFYGLCYWYTWQVTILGLGPIWMSPNEAVKEKAAAFLKEGGVFAFGLSERAHGADIYSTGMILKRQDDGTYLANGSKYYIGNGNCASLVSTFGKIEDTDEYVFFVVRSDHENYECVKKIDTSGVRQAFVAEYAVHDYPITEADILITGKEAWNMALNTVNVGKYELGFASVGIATHCFYEAIHHAANRSLYGQHVTDFPHVKKLFTESFARLNAMKLYGLRAADYMRCASPEDRRYLLFNPIMKMKVTMEGEKTVGMLHDVVAAKGFEQDTYFEMAIRDIGMLPKLEGTVHVNMALIIKFIQHYFFAPVEYPAIPKMNQVKNDGFLFDQVSGQLGGIKFPDYRLAYEGVDLQNVTRFREQVELFRTTLMSAPPSAEQAKNVDFMLAAGELFTLIAYAQLILENVALYDVEDDLVNEIFDFMIRDFSERALQMVLNQDVSEAQEALFTQMVKKPHRDAARFTRLWEGSVYCLKDAYTMGA
jgi:acyl-CoA dehydrogenase